MLPVPSAYRVGRGAQSHAWDGGHVLVVSPVQRATVGHHSLPVAGAKTKMNQPTDEENRSDVAIRQLLLNQHERTQTPEKRATRWAEIARYATVARGAAESAGGSFVAVCAVCSKSFTLRGERWQYNGVLFCPDGCRAP